MSFETYEESAANSEPVLLFVFKYSGKTWYYTSNATDLVFSGTTYTAIAIGSGNFTGTTEITQSNIEINIPLGNEVAELFRVYPPSEVVSATVYCENLLDTDAEFIMCWKGRITNAQWQTDKVVLNTDSIFVSLQRAGLQTRFSKQCTTYIYSPLCKLAPANYKHVVTCGAISNKTLTVQALIGKVDNYFAGGYVEYTDNQNGNTQLRTIRSSESATGNLILAQAPVNLAGGDTILVYPGCDNTLATCDAKFGNTANYRGTPYIPTKSPFGGTTLY